MKRNQTFHEDFIPMLVAGIGASCYLELGVYDFRTISRVKRAHPGCKCVAVDHSPITHAPGGIEFYQMTTEEFFSRDRGMIPEVVFIDADHSAESVRKDFAWAWEILADEGLVLLHDTNPATIGDTSPGLCGDGWEASRDITKDFEAVTLPYHPGLTIVRKRIQWGPEA